MNIYLVRHGLARHNLDDPASCHYDPIFEEIEAFDCSLTEQGEKQAELTGKRLLNVKFDAVLASPTHRTLSTAAGILKNRKDHLTIEVMPSLLEANNLMLKMMPERLYSRIWDDIKLIEAENHVIETKHDTWLRAQSVVKKVKERFKNNENVLIVTHGAFLSEYLNAAFMGLSEEQSATTMLAAENCAITKMRFTADGKIIVSSIDETGHLGNEISREPFDL